MEAVSGWGAAVWAAVGAALTNILGWLPNLLGAAIILLVGWGIAVLLANLTNRGLDAIKFDRMTSRAGLKDATERAGIKLEPSDVLAQLVKWGVFLVAILVAADALGLPQVTAALNSVLGYIPNVIAAILIITFGTLLASFIGKVVRASGFDGADIVGQGAYWAIVVFAALAALAQLNIAPTLIQTLVTAVVGAVALAAAIAFGLGARNQAADLAAASAVRAHLHEGDQVDVAVNGQHVSGRISSITPMLMAVDAPQGRVLVPNHLVLEQVATVRTGAGGGQGQAGQGKGAQGEPRLHVSRLEETSQRAAAEAAERLRGPDKEDQ